MTGAQVLIVDDDPALLEALPETLRLRMDDLQVDTSDSGQAALQRIGETEYDALVVDIKMPGMDGLELLTEIRRARPDTPTILITGHGDHDLAVQALRTGAQDYVTKPIDRDYFVTSLSRAIECRRLSREVAAKRTELLHHMEELEACVHERTVELREALHREQVARQELDAANLRLTEMNRQREVFVSLVAHDLATPLTTIRGYAEMLQRKDASPERQEQARTSILSETKRLSRLARDLADASQLEAGQFQIQTGRCDLVEIVREQVDLAQSSTERHTIRLDAPPGLSMTCDRDRLAQVLSNLLMNAIKYSPHGEIDVRVQAEGEHAIVSVRDHGPGIPAEQADAVFGLGSRLANARASMPSGGSGIGLHIAQRIVEAHSGRIWVEAAEGSGAIFRFVLPTSAAAPAEASDLAEVRSPPAEV
jgi:signal transduction histidine kinase